MAGGEAIDNMSPAPPLNTYYNSQTKFIQIVKIVMQIHAKYALGEFVDSFLLRIA